MKTFTIILIINIITLSGCSQTSQKEEIISEVEEVQEAVNNLGKPIKECPLNSVKFRYENKHIFLECLIKDEPLTLILDLCGIWSEISLEKALILQEKKALKISSDSTYASGIDLIDGVRLIELIFDTVYTNVTHTYWLNEILIDKNNNFGFNDYLNGFINPISNLDKRILYINYEDQYLTFYSTDEEKDSIREELVKQGADRLPLMHGFGGKPYSIFPMKMQIGGQEKNVNWKLLFDTGFNGDILLFSDTVGFNINDAYLDERSVIYTLTDTVNAAHVKMTLNNNVIDSCIIRVYKNRFAEQINHEQIVGLIGNGILDKFYVWVDFEQKYIYLIENPYKQNDSRKLPSINTMKIAYNNMDDYLYVTEVIANGKCGKQGLMPKDLIVGINSKPISSFSKEEINNIFNKEYNNAIEFDIERGEDKLKIMIPEE